MSVSDWNVPRVSPCLSPLQEDPRAAIWPPQSGKTVAEFRERLNAALVSERGPELVEVADLSIMPGDIALRLYRPSHEHGLPVVVFLHGGGFVTGSLETHDHICRSLAMESTAAVIAVDYRLAPESPYPAPLEDCVLALQWVAENAGALRLDPGRIALCGDSAGGQLAIAASLRFQEQGLRICHLGLIYPVIDPLCNSASAYEFAEGYILTRSVMQWFWQCYGGGAVDTTDPALAVMGAPLQGLPSTTILTAEFDPLRDEGEAFVRRLRAEGVSVVGRRYLGMLHGFVSLGSLTPIANQAIRDLSGDLRTCFDEGLVRVTH